MNNKTKHLAIALILGVVVLFLNMAYINSRVDEWRPKKSVKVVRVKKPILSGTQVVENNLEVALVPDQFTPKAAIPWERRNEYRGQQVAVDVKAGDYLMESYFSTRETVANKLSGLIAGENVRAVSLPVDETTSLGRSVVPGDRLDVLFSFNIPMTQQKMSTVLLQNVPVLSTGSYSAVEQEVGERGARQRPYNIVTVLLTAQDAVRLNYAKQAGQINLMLRNPQDTTVVRIEPVTSLQDILTVADQQKIEAAKNTAMTLAAPAADKFREQIKEVLERQRQQQQTGR